MFFWAVKTILGFIHLCLSSEFIFCNLSPGEANVIFVLDFTVEISGIMLFTMTSKLHSQTSSAVSKLAFA